RAQLVAGDQPVAKKRMRKIPAMVLAKVLDGPVFGAEERLRFRLELAIQFGQSMAIDVDVTQFKSPCIDSDFPVSHRLENPLSDPVIVFPRRRPSVVLRCPFGEPVTRHWPPPSGPGRIAGWGRLP